MLQKYYKMQQWYRIVKFSHIHRGYGRAAPHVQTFFGRELPGPRNVGSLRALEASNVGADSGTAKILGKVLRSKSERMISARVAHYRYANKYDIMTVMTEHTECCSCWLLLKSHAHSHTQSRDRSPGPVDPALAQWSRGT